MAIRWANSKQLDADVRSGRAVVGQLLSHLATESRPDDDALTVALLLDQGVDSDQLPQVALAALLELVDAVEQLAALAGQDGRPMLDTWAASCLIR